MINIGNIKCWGVCSCYGVGMVIVTEVEEVGYVGHFVLPNMRTFLGFIMECYQLEKVFPSK